MLLAALALLLSEPACAETLSVQRVGVLQFETSHVGASGLAASDQFSILLQRSFPGVAVVERTRLEKILSEQHFEHESGLVDPESALKLKALLGVDAVVIGNIVAMDLEVEGGGGTMMMTARLVNTSTGRILWAETRTVKVGQPFFKRLARGISGSMGESDALVTGRLIQKAAFELVQDLGRNFGPEALSPAAAGPPTALASKPAAQEPEGSCGGLDTRVAKLGSEILSEESIWWAHRMRENTSVDGTPGAGYPDELRQRLTMKVLFWLGEKDLPPVTPRQAERIAEAKGKMKDLYSLCGVSTVAKFISPTDAAR